MKELGILYKYTTAAERGRLGKRESRYDQKFHFVLEYMHEIRERRHHIVPVAVSC